MSQWMNKSRMRDPIVTLTRSIWTKSSLETLTKQIKYKNYEFRIISKPSSTFLLQPQFHASCNFKIGEKSTLRSGRKWYISPHATKSEVIRTAFKAVLTCEEHETREQFKYNGHAVFSPHIDVDELLKSCEKLDKRS